MFKNSKTGDEVYLVINNNFEKKVIKEITKQRIVLDIEYEKATYDIKTGVVKSLSKYLKQYCYYEDSKIMLVNNENTKFMNDEKLKRGIISKLQYLFDRNLSEELRIKRDSLTLEQLVKVAEILEIEVK
jgi:hypothetical protein